MTTRILASTFTLWGVLTLCADTVSMTANDASGKSSLTNWDASGQAMGTPTSNHDYLANKTLRAPSSGSVSFNGNSLTLGVIGGAECVFVPYGGTYTFNNDGLFLANGRFQHYNPLMNSKLAGTVTLQAPSSKPFGLYFNTPDATKSNLTFTVQATLKGDSGTCWQIYSKVPDVNTWLYLAPVDASAFKGELLLDSQNDPAKYVQCELRNSRTWGGKITVGRYCTLRPQYGSTEWTIAELEYKDGAICGSRSGSGKNGTITVTDRITVGSDITWSYAGPLYAGNGYRVPFIVKKQGATGDLHPGNFAEKVTDRTHESLPRYWFEATTDKQSGDETLFYVQPKVVQIKTSEAAAYGEGDAVTAGSSLTNTVAFQNGSLPQPEYDYVVTKNGFAGDDGNSWLGSRVFTPGPSGGTYSFGGGSLTIGQDCEFKSISQTLAIPSLRLMGNAAFYPRINQSQATVLKGDELFIGPEKDDNGTRLPAVITVYGNLAWTVEPPLTGSGRVAFRANADSGSPGGMIALTGLSTNFLGRILVSANKWNAEKLSAAVNDCVKISDPRQLGGALAAFTADALKLENWGTLEVTETVDFSTANRGVAIGNLGQIRIADGKSFTIGNSITYGGELHKTGAGRLVLGGSAVAGTGAALVVDAGTIEATHTNALKGVDVTFRSGTSLVLDPATTGSIAEYGLVLDPDDLTGGVLPISLKIDPASEQTAYKNVAICTVPAVKIEAVRIEGVMSDYRCIGIKPRNNNDGTITLLGTFGPRGLAIVIR